MANMDGDDKPIEPVQKACPEKIAGKESPEGIEGELEPGGFFSFLKQQLCRQPAIPVVLIYMVVIAGIGVMKEIAAEQADTGILIRHQRFVDNVQAPGTFFLIGQAQL